MSDRMTLRFEVSGQTRRAILAGADKVVEDFLEGGTSPGQVSIDVRPLVESYASEIPTVWKADVTVEMTS